MAEAKKNMAETMRTIAKLMTRLERVVGELREVGVKVTYTTHIDHTDTEE